MQVLDAANLGAGPIARISLPQRVPLGFHATWVPGDRLPTALTPGQAPE